MYNITDDKKKATRNLGSLSHFLKPGSLKQDNGGLESNEKLKQDEPFTTTRQLDESLKLLGNEISNISGDLFTSAAKSKSKSQVPSTFNWSISTDEFKKHWQSESSLPSSSKLLW